MRLPIISNYVLSSSNAAAATNVRLPFELYYIPPQNTSWKETNCKQQRIGYFLDFI